MRFTFDECRGTRACQVVEDRQGQARPAAGCPGVVTIGGAVVAVCDCPRCHLTGVVESATVIS